MGGWIGIAVTAVAAFLLFKSGHPWLGGIAIAVAVAQFWSFGIMHNYAYGPAARHTRALEQLRQDGFPEGDAKLLEGMKPESDPMLAPDWATAVNMVATFLGVGLLIAGIVLWIV